MCMCMYMCMCMCMCICKYTVLPKHGRDEVRTDVAALGKDAPADAVVEGHNADACAEANRDC